MKIKFKGIVESAHGKVDGSSNVSYRTLYGTDHTYTWNRDTKMRLTPQRHLQQEAMRQANLAATVYPSYVGCGCNHKTMDGRNYLTSLA